MSGYYCALCLHRFDESKEGRSFDEVPESYRCPLCMAPKSSFLRDGGASSSSAQASVSAVQEDLDLSYPSDLVMEDGGKIDYIHQIAVSGRSPGTAMDTEMPVKAFDDILVLGAQLARFCKEETFVPDLRTVIGKGAARPMELGLPIYVSHMSFGALSKQAKVALSKGAAMAGTGTCSGEGGVLPEEMEVAHRYIFEYIPNRYSCTKETFDGCDAVEIKVGQGTKPGMGGHLPGEKVTSEIAKIRGKPEGKDILSPSRYPGIDSPEDMACLVNYLREATGGKPVGIKIAAENIEGDLEFISKTGCDFITIDGRGGATGSSPGFLKDNTTVPSVFALARARKYMDEHGMKQELVITGGFRTSGDIIKALAMGADAVALASAPLMALGCQRYRICGSGKCPMGIATHDPFLTSRLDVDVGARRVANYFDVIASELSAFVRITGHDSVHDLTKDDLCTTDEEISKYCGIRHA